MRLILLLLLAMPLFAEREICRFRAGDEVDPFRRWLSSQEVTCSTEAPSAGLWNVFARSGSEVSLPALGHDATAPLLPAAVLTVQLPDAHGGVVYLPKRAVAYPVSGARVLVPADEELWLLVLEKPGVIASLVPIPALEAGAERAVDGRVGGVTSSVIGWLRVAEADRKALQNAGTGISSPQVHLTTTGPAREADPLPPLAALDGAFVLVRGVEAGDAELDLGGVGWLPDRTRVNVGSRIITAVTNALQVRPAASVMVSFSTDDNLLELNSSIGLCDQRQARPARYEITVSACATPKREQPLDLKTCKAVREASFGAEVPYGSFAVDDVAPGTYRVEMRFGQLPPVSATVTAAALQQQSVRVLAPYATVHGTLTRGGAPMGLEATIEFPNGVGFAQRDGEYRGVLLVHPLETDTRIDVAACKGEPRAFVLADEPIKAFHRFNIDIPDNSITVVITDTFTRNNLLQPTLQYVVLSKLFPHRPVVTETLRPDDMVDGDFVLEAVPERKIQLTVSHAGYQKFIVEQFTMTKSEQRKIDVQMLPLRGIRGRIVSPLPFDEGTVTWHAPHGRGETVELAPDGSFAYESAHEAGEIMTVVSRSHPMWVLRMPAVEGRQTLALTFPNAPARTFDVKIAGVDPSTVTSIGMTIGGLPVPSGALFHHQRLRGGQDRIRGNRVQTMFDILESGAIELFADRPDAPRTRLLPGVTEVVLSPASP